MSVSVPEMVRPRQVGSDLPSGVRRPDRAVSLRDVREQPVQTMGFDWVYTNYGYETTSPGGTKVRITGPHKGNEAGSRGGKYWSIEAERVRGISEYEPTLKDAKEVAETMVPLHDEGLEESRLAEEEWAAEAGFDPETGQWEVPEPQEARGLTADEAFQQHHAMAGGEPPREGRAHPERVPAPYEPVPPMSEEQKKLNRENIEKIRRGNPISQMAGPDWDAIEEGDYGAGNWWDTVPGMDDLGEALPDFDEEDLNPELRSMDSQMLADMMVSQPQQGYFGGLGDAVQGLTNRVAGMSGMERAALISALIAAGLITVGSGGMLTPVGVGLAGGAGLTALSQ